MWRKIPDLRVQLSASLSQVPKRPSNPYIHFVSEKFKEESSQHPPKTLSKIILKALGNKWKELSVEEKAVYHQKFSLDKEKYVTPSYLPKRPNKPYNQFVSETYKAEQSQHPPNTHGKLIIASLGDKWKQLSGAQKGGYYLKVSAEKKKYDEFFESVPLQTIYKVEDKKEKKLLLKKLIENGRLPKKPPHSGYTLFISRQKPESNLSNSENMTLYAQRYQKLSDPEKTALTKEVELMKEGYTSSMERVLGNN